MFDDLSEAELKLWIESSLKDGSHILASGYQGQTLKYDNQQHQLVIKVPHGEGLAKKIHVSMLKHEYRAYQKLAGFDAVPKCYGLVDGQYLVLEYIDASTIRKTRPHNEDLYFKILLANIKQMHNMGIAHFDLKKRDNLMVDGADKPCIIDFGVAVIYKSGFHPFKHYWFNLAKRFDYNAWVKHKYKHCLDNISPEDQPYYNQTWIEIAAHKIKRFYKDRLR